MSQFYCREDELRKLIDQRRFSNTSSSINNDALKPVANIPLIEFSKFILTAIKLTHTFAPIIILVS